MTEIRPEDVPVELVQLMADAEYEAPGGCSAWDSYRVVLAAVLPAHEAMVRAKVAEEIGEFRKRGLVAAPYERCQLVALGLDPDGPDLDRLLERAEEARRGMRVTPRRDDRAERMVNDPDRYFAEARERAKRHVRGGEDDA